MDNYEHRGLVLRPTYVPEKQETRRQSNRTQPGKRRYSENECKLRNGLNWQETLKQKIRKTFGGKTRPTCSCCRGNFKRDTSLKCSAWLPSFMFTEFNLVPGNGNLVSLHYDDESR